MLRKGGGGNKTPVTWKHLRSHWVWKSRGWAGDQKQIMFEIITVEPNTLSAN